MPRDERSADVGMIGLAVMGQNLALNMADHGYRVAAFNRSYDVTQQVVREHPPGSFGPSGGELIPCETYEAFVKTLRTPRIIVMLVKAGAPVDDVCRQLIEAGVEADDIVVDGGNSLWTDTIRREKEYKGRLTFFGSGVSGGELGARFGPSLMPGGDCDAWQRLKPIWEAIAAKVDPKTGKPIEGAAPGRPVVGGEPCTAYMGPDGAGHYVKMVHNGIEYADMQLIAEAYDLLRRLGGLAPEQIADVFADWNTGELDSFLIEITADILAQRDPLTGSPLVDVILDEAKMKGTGTWTAINAMELGVPAMSIAEAVFARAMSSIRAERRVGSRTLKGPKDMPSPRNVAQFVAMVEQALYCSKICAYAQGFQLLRAAQAEYNWQFDFGSIARIWRGGCIIRARFLQKITEAYQRDSSLANLLLDSFFRDRIDAGQQAWRDVVSLAALSGVPVPAFSSALSYYDSYRSETLPANLIQAQRDYFGAHTFKRIDQPGKSYHLDWPAPQRPLVEVG
jgi:6-phosphogluconate dehydrogenase